MPNVPFAPSLLDHHPSKKNRYISLPPAELTHGAPRVIRWCSTPDTTKCRPLSTADEALNFVKQHELHLSVLEESGITIPKHRTLIGQEPVVGRIAIYHVVERIEDATPLSGHLDDTLRLIGKALLQYADWVQETHQPQFLLDINTADQYGADRHGNPILIDIEPAYIDTIDPQTGETEWLLTNMQSDAQAYTEL